MLANSINEHIALARQMPALLPDIERAAKTCLAALKNGNKLLFAGNGGSAADAQHIVTEFVCRFELERIALPAIALTTDTSLLTAIGNDFGFERLFARQLEGLAQKGDVFIGISTSGNSQNVLEAIKYAPQKGIKTIALLGKDGGKMKGLAEQSIIIPSNRTARIQEMHILVGHLICEYVEQNWLEKNS